MFRKSGPDQFIWSNPEEDRRFTSFKVDSIEILRRRNKRNDKCLTEETSYDGKIIKQHVEKVGCSAPYNPSYQHIPVCDSDQNLNDFFNNGEFLPKGNVSFPCQEMSHLSFKYNNRMKPIDQLEWYPLHISYPENIKLVTQSQAIDAHALIGNIGGYIGLFLGMFWLICLCFDFVIKLFFL